MKKIFSCSIISKLLTASVAVVAWAASSMTASATDFVFELERMSSDQDVAFVQITVTDDGLGSLDFFMVQTDSDFNQPGDTGFNDDSSYFEGDLRGLFMNVQQYVIAPEDLTFSDFLAWGYDDDGAYQSDLGVMLNDPANIYTGDVGVYNEVDIAGPQNSINPMEFDIGLEFGTPGIRPEKILGVSFTMTMAGGLDFDTFEPFNWKNFFGARITSLPEGGDLDGSTKLTCCTTVPEPSSTMGLLAFAVGGLLWRRRITQ